MKHFFEEFKKFALRGNAVDLAIGVVIGAAFTAITNSLVTNILTPPIGLLLGGIDFSALGFTLQGDAVIQYGLFIEACVNFIITALALVAAAAGIAIILIGAIAAKAEPPPPPNQAYTTLPNGTVLNSAGQNTGRWERDATGDVRFRDGRTGQVSNWKIAPRAGGGSSYIPSPHDMPPRHPGLP